MQSSDDKFTSDDTRVEAQHPATGNPFSKFLFEPLPARLEKTVQGFTKTRISVPKTSQPVEGPQTPPKPYRDETHIRHISPPTSVSRRISDGGLTGASIAEVCRCWSDFQVTASLKGVYDEKYASAWRLYQ
eukprot:2275078-Pyramimonas_sp.AAC.1